MVIYEVIGPPKFFDKPIKLIDLVNFVMCILIFRDLYPFLSMQNVIGILETRVHITKLIRSRLIADYFVIKEKSFKSLKNQTNFRIGASYLC